MTSRQMKSLRQAAFGRKIYRFDFGSGLSSYIYK
jgi:hypothetical protein